MNFWEFSPIIALEGNSIPLLIKLHDLRYHSSLAQGWVAITFNTSAIRTMIHHITEYFLPIIEMVFLGDV